MTFIKMTRIEDHPPILASPILAGYLRGCRWYIGSRGKVFRVITGTYEKHQTEKFVSSISPGDSVFDIGAATGYYTLLSSILVGRQGQVVAFEPMSRNFSFAQAHTIINRLQNVMLFPVAIGNSNEDVGFEAGTGTGTGKVSAADTALRVSMRRIDDIAAEIGIVPTHIKIDVEGAEMDVLKGAHLTLEAYRPTLFLSTHGPALQRTCCEYLSELGYCLESIGPRSLDESDEIFCCAKR